MLYMEYYTGHSNDEPVSGTAWPSCLAKEMTRRSAGLALPSKSCGCSAYEALKMTYQPRQPLPTRALHVALLPF